MKPTLIDVSDQFEDSDVVTRVFDIYVDEIKRIVGRVEYRFESGRDLEYYGNIGYVVYLPYRGHGIALKACQALLVLIKKEYPHLKTVTLTCNPDNEPSRKTIQRLGGVYQYTVDIDLNHELRQYNETQKEVYLIAI